MSAWPIVQGLILVFVANGAPVLAKTALGGWGARPLDFDARFIDGRPLFGRSKTIRGILVSLLATALVAPLLGLSWRVGALAAAAAMAGDLLSSFIKRRLGMEPESMALGLDQTPECLFPLLACRTVLGLSATDVAAATALFLAGELMLSRALYALKIRDRPY